MLPDPALHTLGVLAGAGEYPRLMIEGARRAGMRVVGIGFRGAVGREIPGLCDAYRTFRVGAVEAPLRFFQEQGVTHVVLTGQIRPACIYTMWPDATARRLLARLDRRNAHTIFGTVCDFITAHGFTVLPSTVYMENNMPPAGHLAGPPPTPEQMEEARHGLNLAREIARMDIGQSLVVHGQDVLCVEGYKGTNECLRSGGFRGFPVTLCKVTKQGHDMRFDVPCIGADTIRHCIRAGVNHVVFEARRTILLQKEEVLKLCNEHRITLHAMSLPEPPDDSQSGACPTASATSAPSDTSSPAPRTTSSATTTASADSSAPGNDAAHALALAQELERLGIGHAAVVCEGVVIAVEDPDGSLKCIRRAGAYMKRLRFVRLVNWLCRLLLGRGGTPPAPMTMRGTASFILTPDVRREAHLAGILLPQEGESGKAE